MALAQVGNVNELGPERVGIITDLHLSAHPQCDRPGAGGVSARLLWGAEVLRQARAAFQMFGVREVWNLGDTLHTGKTAVRSMVSDVGLSALRNLHSPDVAPSHLVLTGNHDAPGPEYTALRAVEGWPAVRLVTAPLVTQAPGGRPVVALPYHRDYEVLAADVMRYAVPGCVLLLHAGVQGASVGPERDYFPTDSELSLHALLGVGGSPVPEAVLCGHYHAFQSVHGGLVVYPGAPMHHDFGDAGRVGSVMILDAVSLRFVRLRMAAPEFRTVDLTDAAALTSIKAEVKASPVPLYIRAKIPQGSPVTVDKVRSVLDGVVDALQIVDQRTTTVVSQRAQVVSLTMTDEQRVEAYMTERPPGFAADADGLRRIRDAAVGYVTKARQTA